MPDVAFKEAMTASLYSVVDGSFIGVFGLDGQVQYQPSFKDGVGVAMATPSGGVTNSTVAVAASRSLTSADNGNILECAENITLTVPAGLPAGFRCRVLPFGTTSVASGGGALLNGATTTVTRTSAANYVFDIIGRVSASNSYVVSGVVAS